MFLRLYPGIPLQPTDLIPREAPPPSPLLRDPADITNSPLRPAARRPPPYISPILPPRRSNNNNESDDAASQQDHQQELERLRRLAAERARQLQELQSLHDENARLERELREAAAQASTATQQAAAAGTAAAPTADPTTARLLQLIIADRLVAQETTAAPAIPSWDGESSSKRHFLEEIKVYKSHKYFRTVTDWTKADASHFEHSLHLRKELLRTIPADYRPTYTD